MKSAYTRIHAVKEKEKYEEEKQTKKKRNKGCKKKTISFTAYGMFPKTNDLIPDYAERYHGFEERRKCKSSYTIIER